MSRQAVVTLAARVHIDAHSGIVADCKASDIRTHRDHAAYDFVPGHNRKMLVAPVAVDRVNVRVTHTGVSDFNLHIARPYIAALELEGNEIFSRFKRCIATCC